MPVMQTDGGTGYGGGRKATIPGERSPMRKSHGTLLGAAVLLVCALWDVGVLRWRPPTLRRQTPKWVLCYYGPAWGGFVWGLDLGQGWTTRVEFAGYYGLAAWAVLTASPCYGALVVGAFGLGRALPVVVAGALVWRLKLDLPSVVQMWRTRVMGLVDAVALAAARYTPPRAFGITSLVAFLLISALLLPPQNPSRRGFRHRKLLKNRGGVHGPADAVGCWHGGCAVAARGPCSKCRSAA